MQSAPRDADPTSNPAQQRLHRRPIGAGTQRRVEDCKCPGESRRGGARHVDGHVLNTWNDDAVDLDEVVGRNDADVVVSRRCSSATASAAGGRVDAAEVGREHRQPVQCGSGLMAGYRLVKSSKAAGGDDGQAMDFGAFTVLRGDVGASYQLGDFAVAACSGEIGVGETGRKAGVSVDDVMFVCGKACHAGLDARGDGSAPSTPRRGLNS
ncbi:hypothetical protein [Gordonia sp. i37]|uniref:hypothetical protein n=2 Tax=Gordonia TaxID=2053 RepID=UPI0034535593